jgi:hypothetical protein
MKTLFRFLKLVWRAETFSPTAFVARAAIITLLFCTSEALGFREYTSFLSGTTGNAEMSWQTSATLGLIHLMLYIAFILCVPIFLITAGLLAFSNRIGSGGLEKQCDRDAIQKTQLPGESEAQGLRDQPTDGLAACVGAARLRT